MMNSQQLHRAPQTSQIQTQQLSRSPQKHNLTQQLQPTHSQLAKKRLKDSCNNCSLSKVKCNKSKPSCKRCQERGLYCYYCPSQRSGRRSASTLAVTTAPTTLTPITPRTSVTTYHPRSPPAKFIPKDVVKEMNPFDDFPNITYEAEFQPWEPTSASNLTFDNNTFDPILISPLTTYSTSDATGQYSGGQELSPPASVDDLDYLLNNFAGNTPPTPHTPFSLRTPGHIDTLTPSGLKSIPDIPHSCLNLALNIIPMLQSSLPTCALVSISQEKHKLVPSPSIEHIIATHKAIIDSLSLILSCNCSLDEHLASIISIIIFQILTSFVSAAREADHIPNPVVNRNHGYHPNRLIQPGTPPMSNRIRVQLILSEIHRVTTIVDVLSTRFKEARGYIDIDTGSSVACDMRIRSHCISASVFAQLELDLRRRLGEVMNEVMQVLRGG
ncbi:hypothetical protein F5884DRAFT_503407 [Xylogone sp. PMI_703]|nr:hypothetical protein F5884DRAFT_503407 [Xylogone sp. PMI_703]